MIERRRAPRFSFVGRLASSRTMTSELTTPAAFSRVVVARAELLSRSGVQSELFSRIERAGLVRAIGRSPTEVYYPREAIGQVERVQTLIAAGYAERDVAHVVGKAVATHAATLDRVIELDLDRPELRALSEAGLIPLWAVTDAGQPLIHVIDVPLCDALAALPVVGLGELSPALAEVGVGAPSRRFEELAVAIDTRLTVLNDASAQLRKALALLRRRAHVPRKGLRRLLRTAGPR